MLKNVAAVVQRRCCKILKKLHFFRNDRQINIQKINRVEPMHSVPNDSKTSQIPSTPPFPRTVDTGSIYENVCYDSAYDSDDFEEEESKSVANETLLYGERFDNIWNQTIESLVVLACISGHHPV